MVIGEISLTLKDAGLTSAAATLAIVSSANERETLKALNGMNKMAEKWGASSG